MHARADLPSICIIGAGPSGLAVCKTLHEEGIGFECFEAGDRVGGQWAFKNSSGKSGAYRSLHSSRSRETLAYSDFTIPESYPDFPYHEQIAAYLEAYVDQNGFRQKINLNAFVNWCDRLDDGTWAVTVQGGETRFFDILCIANGHHWDPYFPEWDYTGEFAGERMHSHSYVDPVEPLDCIDKNIVIVGMGNSALEIACELGLKGVAKSVYLSSRRGYYITPKYVGGRPWDYAAPGYEWPWPELLKRAFRRRRIERVVGRPEDHGLPKPDHSFGAAHPAISDEIHVRIGSGDVIPKPAIRKYLGDRIQFVDGSEVDADILIFATGYKVSFPFFDRHFLSATDNDICLYKRVLDPQYSNLFFVGLVQSEAAIMPIAEEQAKLFADYVTGRYALPTTASMNIDRHAFHDRMKSMHLGTPRHTLQVDARKYLEDLRTERSLGAKRATLRGNPLPIVRKAHRRTIKIKTAPMAAA